MEPPAPTPATGPRVPAKPSTSCLAAEAQQHLPPLQLEVVVLAQTRQPQSNPQAVLQLLLSLLPNHWSKSRVSPPPGPNSAPVSLWPRLLRRALWFHLLLGFSGQSPVPRPPAGSPPLICHAPSLPVLLSSHELVSSSVFSLVHLSILSVVLTHISLSSSSSLQESSTHKSNPEPQLGRAHCKPQSQLRPSPALNSASCLPSLPSPSVLGCVVLAQV